MNNLKMLFVRIVSIVFFVHKEVRCASKTEIKDGLQYANKKPSVSGDMIIYTPDEDLVMNQKHCIFFFSSGLFIFIKQHGLL